MGKPKFQGLQIKFENCIHHTYAEQSHFNYQDIIKAIKPFYKQFDITDEEFFDLERNLSNYLSRSITNDAVLSLGRKKGYKLNKDSTSLQPASSADCKPVMTPGTKSSVSKESFLHFPATLLLSQFFNSRVFSLPCKTTNLRWANPDMFMLRRNKKFEYDEDLSLEVLRFVDSSPQLIISSIELKYGLTNRAGILAALSETAINGSWANENWLVYFEEKDNPIQFDEDCFDFARSNRIGILRIKQIDDPDKAMTIEQVLSSTISNTLQLNSEFGENRKMLLTKIIQSINVFKEYGTYMDQDIDYAKLSTLILQAVNNLILQKDFPDSIESFIQDFDKYEDFAQRKTHLFNIFPQLILTEKIDKSSQIKKAIGKSFSGDDVEAIINILQKFEEKGNVVVSV